MIADKMKNMIKNGSVSRWTVTPEIATWLLSLNTHNREVRRVIVDKYAQEMLAGRWLFTHQGIAVSKSGFIIDGQHRLLAIVQSGKNVELMVTTGADDETQLVVDDHAKRTVANALTLIGMEVTGRHTAVANAMMSGPSSQTFYASKQVLRDFILKYSDGVEFCLGLFHRKTKGLATASMVAVFGRAFYSHDAEKLRMAAEILNTGFGTDRQSKSLITLRNSIMANNKGGGAAFRVDVYRKTQRCLLAYLQDESLEKAYASEDDLFPLPQKVSKSHAEKK